MLKKITFMFLACVLVASAQTMVGLPQYGVTLTGNNLVPIIHNNSGKVVIGYVIKFSDDQGRGPNQDMFLYLIPTGTVFVAFGAAQPGGIPKTPISVEGHMPAPGPIQGMAYKLTQVILDGVLFEDGTFVGPDKEGLSERFKLKLQMSADLGLQLTAATDRAPVWAQFRQYATTPIQVHTTPNILRRDVAKQLVQIFDSQGEQEALTMAARYAALPELRKQ